MITLHPSNKAKGKDIQLTIEQLKEMSHLILWKKIIKYIDGSSIDMEFMSTFKDILDKHNLFTSFVMKSTHLDVIKMFEDYKAIPIRDMSEMSEEYVSYYKTKITRWYFLVCGNYKISEKFFEEVYPYICSADNLLGRLELEKILLKLMINNPNLSEEFLRKYRTPILEMYYISESNKTKCNGYGYLNPSFKFLKVYKDITSWEIVMKYAPLSLFTKAFVVEFYQYIAPLCLSMSNIDPKKINKISQYRKYVKKDK